MRFAFTKMHGAGNDFVVIDDRDKHFPVDDQFFIQHMAARRTGVGCDGILLIQTSDVADLRMRFINPDGGEQAMCGNGARCFARYAFEHELAPAAMGIETGAGVVRASVEKEKVFLHMPDPKDMVLHPDVGVGDDVGFVNTGVPHVVVKVDDLGAIDLLELGRRVRYSEPFAPDGTNVNFIKVLGRGALSIRTYERGVEGETLACGTGVTAAALVAAAMDWADLPVDVHCASGELLRVEVAKSGALILSGSAEFVFEGEIEYGNRI